MIPLLAKENQAPEFGIRQLESFTLVLHPVLTALKQFGDELPELADLMIGHEISIVFRLIVHTMNYNKKNWVVKVFFAAAGSVISCFPGNLKNDMYSRG